MRRPAAGDGDTGELCAGRRLHARGARGGVAFVYWFSGIGGNTKRAQVRIVFTGTVTGLSRGSNVLFNGLRVGEVTDIRFLPDDPQRIYATVDIDRTTPIRSDTRARLEAQGLTGVVAIQMIGGEPRAPFLLPTPGQPLPTIFAEKSEFQDLLETARTIARRVSMRLSARSRLSSAPMSRA